MLCRRNATDCVDNVFLGSFAGRCNDGRGNIFLGINSGKGSATVCCNTAGHNIAIGESAGCGLLTGCSNVFLGMYAGKTLLEILIFSLVIVLPVIAQ